MENLIKDCRLAAATMKDVGTFETGQSILIEAADGISRLVAALADMTRQRDEARKLALEEVKAKVWDMAMRMEIHAALGTTTKAKAEEIADILRALAEGKKI